MGADNEIGIELKDKAGFFLKLEKLKKEGLDIKVNLKIDVKDIKKQIQDQLMQQSIKLNNFQVTPAAIKSINNQITNGLMEKPIKINNIEVAQSATNRIRKALEQALNNLEVNVKPKVSGSSASSYSGGSGTYLGPNIDGSKGSGVDQDLVNRITKELGLNLKTQSSNARSSGFQQSSLDELKQGVIKELTSSVAKDVNLSLKTQSSNANASGFISQSLRSAKEQIARTLADSVAKDVGLALKVSSINNGTQGFQQLSSDQFKQLRADSVANQVGLSTKLQYLNSTAQGGQFQTLDQFRQHQNDARTDLEERNENRGFFGHFSQDKFILGEATRLGLHSSSIKRRRFFDTGRLGDLDVQRQIGHTAANALLFQGPLEAVGAGLGGAIGGSIAGTAGAAFGGPVGVAAAGLAVGTFKSLTEALIEVSKAGLAYQRSVIAISGTLLESTQVVNAATGQPLSGTDQLQIQRKRADEIQRRSRAAAASIGIGGEAESNLVQSIITGAGSKGINLSGEGTASLVQRFGAAINLYAPDLVNNPNFIRRDLTDILSGSGAASRTTLGSRLGPVLSQIGPAGSEKDLLKATQSLDKLIFAFQNSGDAVTKIQLFGAQVEKIKQDFGKDFVDQLSPGLKALNVVVSDPKFGGNLSKIAIGIGNLANAALETATSPDFLKAAGLVVGTVLPGSTAIGLEDLGNISDASSQVFVRGLDTDAINQNDSIENYLKDQKLLKFEQDPLFEAQKYIKILTGENKLPSANDLARNSSAFNLYGGFGLLKTSARETGLSSFADRNTATDYLIKGARDSQDLSASQFGTSFGGSLEGIKSRFSGEFSYDNVINALESVIKKNQDELGQFKPGSQEEASALGILETKQKDLQSLKDSRFSNVLQFGSQSGQLAELEAQGISRVSFKDQLEGSGADIDAIRARISGRGSLSREGLSDFEKQQLDLADNADQASINKSEAGRSTQEAQLVQQYADLNKNLVNVNAELEKFPKSIENTKIQFELLDRSAYELSKQQSIDSLRGEDKIIASIKDFQEKGGSLSATQNAELLTAVGGDLSKYSEIVGEANFGPGISRELKERNISSNNLDLAISQQIDRPFEQKIARNNVELQRIDLAAKVLNANAERISLSAQAVTLIGEIEQAQGGDGSKLAAAKKDLLPDTKDKDGKANPASKKLNLTDLSGVRQIIAHGTELPSAIYDPDHKIRPRFRKNRSFSIDGPDEEIIPSDGSGGPVNASATVAQKRVGLLGKIDSLTTFPVQKALFGDKEAELSNYDKITGNSVFNQIKAGENIGKLDKPTFDSPKAISPSQSLAEAAASMKEVASYLKTQFAKDVGSNLNVGP